MVRDGAPAGGRLGHAPAKLNLGLRVLGRRSDGFHDIDTTMVALDLHDEITLGPGGGADELLRRPSGDAPIDAAEMPLDGRNLILRAVALYRAAAGASSPPPSTLTVRKHIPLAAGLGGGSSDAAATLRLLEQAHPADVDLEALAAQLGSDVPFFLVGRRWARARGRGECLERLPDDALVAVLVNPGVAVSAADAYGWWSPAVARRMTPWRGFDLTNDLEAGVAAHVGAVGEVLAWLRAATTHPVSMSGSGATCFAIVDDDAAAEALADAARRAGPWWVRVVRVAPRPASTHSA